MHKAIAVVITVLLISVVVSQSNAASVVGDDLLSVSFVNDRQGWAAGRWGAVVKTEDGGRTWSRQHTGTDFVLTSVFFIDPQYGWAVGEQGTIIHTADGGRTWSVQDCPIQFFLMDVHFASRDKGWAVGEQTHILHTKNGGKTWEVQFSDEDFILKSVSFADQENGWAVGEFGFTYHTSDGGQTWVLQAGFFDFAEETGEMIGGNYLFDVKALSATQAWAVGIDGYAIRTTDAGATWMALTGGIPKTHLFSLAINNEGTVAIVGNGLLIVSHDDGRTWQTPEGATQITYGWLYGVSAPVGEGFVAVGKEGCVLVADSKANNWELIQAGSPLSKQN